MINKLGGSSLNLELLKEILPWTFFSFWFKKKIRIIRCLSLVFVLFFFFLVRCSVLDETDDAARCVLVAVAASSVDTYLFTSKHCTACVCLSVCVIAEQVFPDSYRYKLLLCFFALIILDRLFFFLHQRRERKKKRKKQENKIKIRKGFLLLIFLDMFWKYIRVALMPYHATGQVGYILLSPGAL